MTPEEYDVWYGTPRGRWIGETEFDLLRRMLASRTHESILDTGCGTGWFTRRLAESNDRNVTGLDIDPERLAYARSRGLNERYVEGDMSCLPFPDASFDHVISVTALCFVSDWRRALAEMVRVARQRVVVGLLNRHSLLWREKGRPGGLGGYRGAHWHDAGEVRAALSALPIANVTARSAIFLPGAGPLGRACERCLPNRLPWGGFLAIAADKQGR